MDARSASDAEIHQDTLLMKHSRTHRINTWIILETARWLLVGVQYRGPIHRCYRSSSRQKSASCSTLLLCAALQPGFKRKKKEIVSRIFEANLILKRNPTAKPSRFGTILEQCLAKALHLYPRKRCDQRAVLCWSRDENPNERATSYR